MITGGDGQYALYGSSHRPCTVNYYRAGFVAVRQEVSLKAEETTTVDVVLVPK